MFLLAVTVLSLLCTTVVSQDAASSLTIALPVPDDEVCYPPIYLAAASADDSMEQETSQQLDNGAITVEEAQSRVAYPPFIPIPRCEDGPRRIIHTVPNEFHWPPIFRGSCDNLFCRDPPCLVRRKVWRRKCVLVFKLIKGYWVKVGFRIRTFLDHLSCECKQCSDIRDRWQCIATQPCPNSNRRDSFCYWIPFPIYPPYITSVEAEPAADSSLVAAPIEPVPFPRPIPIPFGRCDCCTPIYCSRPMVFDRSSCSCECPKIWCPTGQTQNPDTCRCECIKIRCPPGQTQNPDTCRCECPDGSKPNENARCIGDCGDIALARCADVFCDDNPHLKCRRNGYQCECPSCSDVDPAWCAMTKCLEQPRRPKCVLDSYSYQCRCPRCDDQNDIIWCLKTSCGYNANTQCRWEYAWNRCFCPAYPSPPTLPPPTILPPKKISGAVEYATP